MTDIIKEPDFPRNEYDERFKKLRVLMEKNGMDAVLVSEEVNLTYFAGFRKMSPLGTKIRSYLLQFCLLPRDAEPILILPLMNRGNAESWSWIQDQRFFNNEDPMEMVSLAIKEKGLGNSKIGAELGMNMRFEGYTNDFQSLRAKLPNVNYVDASPMIWELRSVKSSSEISCLRKSCDITQKAVNAGFRSIRTGMTETELLRELYRGALDAGAADLPLKLYFWIRSGPSRYLMRDSRPSALKKIESGDLVIVDGGVGFKGYMSDFIRTASVGQPEPEQKKMYDLAVESQTVALENMASGVDGAVISQKALDVFEKAGYSKNIFSKQIAHGIGLEIHEFPFIAANIPDTRLKTGNTLSVEPFLYDSASLNYLVNGVKEGTAKGIFIVEDEIAVTDNGIDNMTPMDKELFIIKR
ncbi:MAG: Xaa-Pro peptidase family protein [archaeon]|nr:Xaa-Pro peptidase family protein [archaeon]